MKIIERTANIINIYHVLPTKGGSRFSANLGWRGVITTKVHLTESYVTTSDYGYPVSIL